MKSANILLTREMRKTHLTQMVWHLPFVYVFERSDFIVKLYGANIYPATIRKALQSPATYPHVTGKFSLRILHDAKQNQYMEINVELKPNTKPVSKLSTLIQKTIVTLLLRENSEYESNYKGDPAKQIPTIMLWAYEDPHFFKPGTKQKWVQK